MIDSPIIPLQALKEKTELQAQLATVNAQLRAESAQGQASQEKQSTLTSEVGALRQSCGQLERAMVELQGSLESRNASLASLGTDLQVAEEQYQRLMGKVEEMQKTVTSRDNTGMLVWQRTSECFCNISLRRIQYTSGSSYLSAGDPLYPWLSWCS